MTYILSDLEGSSVETTIKKICKNEPSIEKIFITGDIIDSTMLTFDLEILKDHKSNNLENINYCVFNNNLSLLLGNRDLNKIKLINALKIELPDDSSTFTDQQQKFKDFNDGNVDMDRDIYYKYFAGQIPWKYPLSDFLPIWHEGSMKQYEDYTDFNVESSFITRFKYIFIITMSADNLLYSIPYEITKNLRYQNALFSRTDVASKIDAKKICDTNMQIKDEKSLIDIDADISTFDKYLNNSGKIDISINAPHKGEHHVFNYYAFIVFAVFISLLCPIEDNSEDATEYIEKHLNNPQKIKRLNFNSNNSRFCKNLLYILYMKESTKMMYLHEEKYLLSHGGITKYCINLFNNDNTTNAFLGRIKIQYNHTFEKNMQKNLVKQTNQDFDLTHDKLLLAIKKCNLIFKLWIYESYDSDSIKSENSLKYLSYFTTESANASVIETNPGNIRGRQYCSPIGPGFVSLTDVNIQYVSTDKPIIQIFGHKPFGFANSFYKINEKNMLICLDVSNSFSTTTLNNKYNSYNYIFIKHNNLTSKSKVCLKKSELDTIQYTNINCTPESKSKLYYNSEYAKEFPDVIALNISNNVNIANDNIQYTNYEDAFSLLNSIFNKCSNDKATLIYNGYIHDTDKPFFIFTVIKDFSKDFYILLFKDIFKDIHEENNEFIREYQKDKIDKNYTRLKETLNTASAGSSYKYLKYKNKYLKLKK